MERVPGVAVTDVRRDIDMKTEAKETKLIPGFVRQLRDLRCHSAGIGDLHFRKDIN